MTNRFKNQLYTKEIRVFRDRQLCSVESDDGTLFSGHYRTKILAQDLPEWYVYGRYYKCWGYLSTKGITDMLYVPNRFTNHFLKDDCLYIAYGGKVKAAEPSKDGAVYPQYSGFDERIWGNEIISILQGAQIYSSYDISALIQQLKDKKDWLVRAHPNEFGPGKWDFDVDECFSRPFNNGHPPRYYALTLDNYFSPSFVSSTKPYYGTLDGIKTFVEALDYEKHKTTVDAFHEYLEGNTAATHNVAYTKHTLLEPVTYIKDAFLYLTDEEWDFKNAWGCIYKMRVKSAHMNAILIKDGDRYVRCVSPVMEELFYRSELIDDDRWSSVKNVWGHPGILVFDDEKADVIRSSLYLPEKQYDDVKLAVAGLDTEKVNLDIICEDIIADG